MRALSSTIRTEQDKTASDALRRGWPRPVVQSMAPNDGTAVRKDNSTVHPELCQQIPGTLYASAHWMVR